MNLKADSEFMGLVSTKSTTDVLKVMDAVMDKLHRVNPTLYKSTLAEIDML